MSKKRLTKWFGREVKPLINGVYQVRDAYLDSNFYCYFNGSSWYYGNKIADKACTELDKAIIMHPHEMLGWRGLAEKP